LKLSASESSVASLSDPLVDSAERRSVTDGSWGLVQSGGDHKGLNPQVLVGTRTNLIASGEAGGEDNKRGTSLAAYCPEKGSPSRK